MKIDIKIINKGKREKRPPYKFKSGAVYDGEWIDNMRDGYGVHTWADGARYEGNRSFWQLAYFSLGY